jgi:hypothetical protein
VALVLKKEEQVMAFLNRIEAQDAQPITLSAAAANDDAKPEFSPLEWSVIRLAQIDRLWTIRAAGRLRRFWNALLGRGNPQLANPKLEALRRMAVLSWHYSFSVPGQDVADFLSAGFSSDQYELMVTCISDAVRTPQRIAA